MDRIDEFLKSLLNKTKEERDLLREKEHVCPSEETIACYLDNLLKDTERGDFEEHLTKCDDCFQQTIMLHGLKKEIIGTGYMAVPTEATERAKNIVPESSVKSLINIISEFIDNTIRAKRGYRFVSYGSIALIVMLSVGVYSVMLTEPTIELSMRIIDPSKNVERSVSRATFEEGSVLQSGDKFKVQFKTSKDAYVYIIIYDSLNKATQLFPDPEKNLFINVKANESYTVPPTSWFLDENVGTETVYVLASETPLENIKALLLEMEDVEEPKQKIMEFAKENNSAFKTISFRHIEGNALK